MSDSRCLESVFLPVVLLVRILSSALVISASAVVQSLHPLAVSIQLGSVAFPEQQSLLFMVDICSASLKHWKALVFLRWLQKAFELEQISVIY